MPNVFLSLPVPAGDGVGAWVDVSSQGPERTVAVDGGAFGGTIYLECSNDGQVSAAPAAAGPFVGPTFAPQTFVQGLNFMRVRRSGSGGVGTPTVTLAAPAAVSNAFGAMNVPSLDGVGTPIDLSGGGDVNTFQVEGPYSGQILIETSTDGVNFSPTLLFTIFHAVGQTVQGVLSAARVRRRGVSSATLPLVSVGSQATSGAAGGAFPGYAAAPPKVAAASAGGVSALVSRGDHTHGQDLTTYTPSVVAMQGTGLVTQTSFVAGVATFGLTAIPTGFPGFGGAPPLVASASAAGAAGTASRSDHTHGQDLSVVYAPSQAAGQATGVLQQTYAAPNATPSVFTAQNGQMVYGLSTGLLTSSGTLLYDGSHLAVLAAGSSHSIASMPFFHIGTSSDAGFRAIGGEVYNTGATAFVEIDMVRGRGTATAFAPVVDGDVIGILKWFGASTTTSRGLAAFLKCNAWGAPNVSTPNVVSLQQCPDPATNGQQNNFAVSSLGDIRLGAFSASIPANTTNGFVYYPMLAGPPTGVPSAPTQPTAWNGAPTAIENDLRFYAYLSGAWHFAQFMDYDPTATRVPFGGATTHTLVDSASFTYSTATGFRVGAVPYVTFDGGAPAASTNGTTFRHNITPPNIARTSALLDAVLWDAETVTVTGGAGNVTFSSYYRVAGPTFNSSGGAMNGLFATVEIDGPIYGANMTGIANNPVGFALLLNDNLAQGTANLGLSDGALFGSSIVGWANGAANLAIGVQTGQQLNFNYNVAGDGSGGTSAGAMNSAGWGFALPVVMSSTLEVLGQLIAGTSGFEGLTVNPNAAGSDTFVGYAGATLAAAATHGYPYIPALAAIPTGAPNAFGGAGAPIAFDENDHLFMIRNIIGGAWEACPTFSLTAAAGIGVPVFTNAPAGIVSLNAKWWTFKTPGGVQTYIPYLQ